MQLVTHANVTDYLDHTRDYLERDEIRNSLILGVTLEQSRNPDQEVSPDAFYATFSEGRNIRGTAMITRPGWITLSIDAPYQQRAGRMVSDYFKHSTHALQGVFAPSGNAESFAQAWCAATGRALVGEERMTSYELRTVAFHGNAQGTMRLATEDDLPIASEWQFAFQYDIGESVMFEQAQARALDLILRKRLYFWEDSRPVSMAASVRPSKSGICISSVYTPPELRGQGYATACVARLSQSLLDAGKAFCMLFADVDNPTSNAIYCRIGYAPCEEFARLSFAE